MTEDIFEQKLDKFLKSFFMFSFEKQPLFFLASFPCDMALLRLSSLCLRCRSSPSSALLLKGRFLSSPTTEQQQHHPTNTKKKGLLGKLREYGIPFTIYWTAVWAGSGVGLYGVIEGLEVDLVRGVEGVLDEYWKKDGGWELGVSSSSGNVAAAVVVCFLMLVVFVWCLGCLFVFVCLLYCLFL